MNAFSFIDLIWEIFGSGLPNLEKIEKKGLLSVKIGQMFALRIDFLTPEKCAHLARLYQNNPSLPPEDFHKLLDRCVDGGWRQHFSYIEEEPLATASVAQVHRAKLKTEQGDKDVVIKILKEDYSFRFKRDVNKVLKLFKILIFFYPKLRKVANPIALLKMIKKDTLSELDLENEIRHQKILKDIFFKYRDHVDLRGLQFPSLYPDLSNSQVLVMEEIKGETFQDKLENRTLDYQYLLNLFHLHGFYIFGVGTFHGDIHPGNIILKDNDIYFVDCGALAKVSERLRKGLFHFMKNLSFYRFDQCAKWLHYMSENRLSNAKFEQFRAKFLDLYKDFPGKSVSEISLTKKMMHTIKLGVDHGMAFGEGMFPVIKSLMYLDGMVIRCQPQAVLMEDMQSYVEELEQYV